MFPFLGWCITVSYFTSIPTRTTLQDSGTPEEHASYVWKNYVLKAMAKHVDIVAHSYGGVVTVSLVSPQTTGQYYVFMHCFITCMQLNSYFSDFKKRVHKIALTNSAHSYNPVGVAQTKWRWLAEVRPP